MTSFIPRPAPDSDSIPFWEGLQKKELLIQRCDHCQKHIFYPRSICPYCFAEDISWIKSTGLGHIYSYTVVHQAFGAFKEQAPFVVGIVELDEGVRMMTRILGDRKHIVIGNPVEIVYKMIDDDLSLPYFRIN